MKALREPLLHFFLLGALLFAAHGWLRRNDRSGPESIVVTRDDVDSLAAAFARTWQRPPSGEELESLIDDHVREEVYVRAAIAMGLDDDDVIIRRRLRQKMEFVSEDLASRAEPTDDQLRAYLESHPDAFRAPRRLSFRQVYLDPARHGENVARDAEELLVRLGELGPDADVSGFGDSVMLESAYPSMAETEIARLFGDQFAAALGALPLGRWQGPIRSGYGLHLVAVSERREGRMPDLDEARDAVRREWDDARRLEANETFYQGLLKQYVVTIDAPGVATK